jgi:PIN domain nuclease of toxin-antitoxin system
MKYLLDSHVVCWLRFNPLKLPGYINTILENEENQLYYSVVTPWELSIKHAKGKLHLPEIFFSTLPDLGLECVGIEHKHVEALRQLPHLHHDPFDRMLVAQAKEENLTFITADTMLADYPIKTLLVKP